jgi:hypothetical protein
MSGTHRMQVGRAALRPLALLLAMLAHVAAVLLLLATWRPAEDSAAPEVLVYVQPISPSRAAPARPSRPVRKPPRTNAAPPPSPAGVPEPPAPSTAIELPSVDWQRELQRSARNVIEAQVESGQKLRSLDSRPQVLQLPRVSTDPKPGDVAVLPNGDLLVTLAHGWSCIHSQPALDEAFSVWAKHRPPRCTKKGSGSGSGKIELPRRDYLREPLPDPPAAD